MGGLPKLATSPGKKNTLRRKGRQISFNNEGKASILKHYFLQLKLLAAARDTKFNISDLKAIEKIMSDPSKVRSAFIFTKLPSTVDAYYHFQTMEEREEDANFVKNIRANKFAAMASLDKKKDGESGLI